MILSDTEIRAAIKAGQIVVTPAPEPEQFTSSALDLRLSPNFFRWIPEAEMPGAVPGIERQMTIDPSQIKLPHELFNKGLRKVQAEADGSYVLRPGKFVLGETLETISLPLSAKLAARVEGRSTLARCGLIVHLTAPVIHAGFNGIIVLEMCNHGEHPIKLVPNVRYCQLVFERLGKKPSNPPATAFQGQKGVRKGR